MGRRNREPFRRMLERLVDRTSQVLFEKARLASHVAKIALGARGGRAAYRLKDRLLAATVSVDPHSYALEPDPAVGRWILTRRRRHSLHWRRLGEAI